MKTKHFRLLMIILIAVMMFALSLNVMAAKSNEVIKDGLTAQLFTDKDLDEAVDSSDTSEDSRETGSSEGSTGNEGSTGSEDGIGNDGGDNDYENSGRMEALLGHMQTALTYGRNIEGAIYPNLFVDGLNIDTLEPTIWNKGTSNSYTQSNLYAQFNFLKALDGMTLLTGDEKYSEAALEQFTYRFNNENLVDQNGLLYAGGHSLLDVMTGKRFDQHHETKDYQVPWELMYKADPEGTERFITAYWNAHIYDWSSLIMNRHGYFNAEMSDAWNSEYTNSDPYVEASTAPFLSTGNDLMEAAWFLSEKTGDSKYATWGERMLDKYIGVSNKDTAMLGGQYGTMVTDEYGLDRFLYSFIGADFVTDSGFNFKTATMEDYKIAGTTHLVSRNTLKCTAAYGAQDFAEIYRKTGNEKIYEYIKNNLLSWARYIYDPDRHVFLTPLLSDGTDLNDGENKLIATKTGYYISEGKSFAESEAVWSGVLSGSIDVCSVLKQEDATVKAEIWAAARAFAENEDLGDIGTDMGENVNVNLDTICRNPEYTVAIVKLYKYTGNEQYLELACKMADNIVETYYDADRGMFVVDKNAPYMAFDTPQMYAVFCVEAAVQGFVNEINLDLSHGGVDVPHEGLGQVNSGQVWFDKTKVDVESVGFEIENLSIVVEQEPETSFSDLTEATEVKAIRQISSLKVMSAEADGLFHPEKSITHEELIEMITKLFGFTPDEANSLDEMQFNAKAEVTRAQMAYMIVRALKLKNPETTYNVSNALYRLIDADAIPDWARDYADIATNYRLMVDIEENQFNPDAIVTKDMAAGIFAEVCRYIELPQLSVLLPMVTPHDADSSKLYWETMDSSIVEVDQQGRLYPVSVGTTEIKVTSDSKTANLMVTVAVQEDWMVKEVYINGELLNEFSPVNLIKGINLDKGTSIVPTITAVSYSGKNVIIEHPDSLPGTVEFYVEGCDEKYSLHIDNTFIDYIVDEDFNCEFGTPIEEITTEKFNWFINGTTIAYKDRWIVTSRTQVNVGEENSGCMVFPYVHKKNVPGKCYLTLTGDNIQVFGDEADDKLLVVEMEIAVKNMAGKEKGFGLTFNQPVSGTTYSAARFIIDENGTLARKTSSSATDRATRRQLTDGEFITFRIVMDKKNRVFHYYYGEDLVAKDIPFFHEKVTSFGSILIETPKEDADSQAELYIDNLKVYNLTHAAYEEMFSQTVAPAPTPSEEWLNNPINENYNDYEVGITIQDTGKYYYECTVGGSGYGSNGTVVNKSDIDSNAASTDKCIELKYLPDATADGNFRFNLDSLITHLLGDEAEATNLVLEMDLAVSGEDTKEKGYMIAISQRLGTGYSSLARFVMYDDKIARNISSDKLVDESKHISFNKGEFITLKIVIDKQTKHYCYYINNELIETCLTALHPSVPNFGTLMFSAIKEDTSGVDSKLYVDNLKVYVAEPDEEPIPSPIYHTITFVGHNGAEILGENASLYKLTVENGSIIAIPDGPEREADADYSYTFDCWKVYDPTTQTVGEAISEGTTATGDLTFIATYTQTAIPEVSEGPYVVDIDFDDFTLGQTLNTLSGTNWQGIFGNKSYNSGYNQLVAKTVIDSTADSTDYCMEFTPLTSLERESSLDVNFGIDLADEKAFSLGSAVTEDKYAVIEMDIAIKGTDVKANGFKVQMNEGIKSNSVARFVLNDTQIGHHTATSASAISYKADATKGEFGHLKCVIDRETRKYTYYWNGVIIASGCTALQSNGSKLDVITFNLPWEQVAEDATSYDSKFYVDNIKVYGTDEAPVVSQ